MGIRFYCPNGHKLNVKERLVGKRGICPHCGVALLIPHKSTRLSSRDERKLTGGVGGNPNDFDVFEDNQEATNGGHGVADLPSAIDDPNVVWYVQLPDGQRFGPATLPILQTWVKERRISPTMLVWREDWQDWLEARQVFPEIEQIFQKSRSKQSDIKPNSPQSRFDDQRLDTGEETQKTSAMVIIMIVLTVLILRGILFYILKP
ncbi:MAG: DUF4339 domain-containing protein [Planctomycetaceae bacterium]|nr:DUF4339 domain-containing protein [Planctomycetaceae bacterium]